MPPPTALMPPAADLAAFRAVLGRVRAQRPALASVLEHAALLRCDAERVVLGYEAGSFLAAQATEPGAVALLTAAARGHLGDAAEVSLDAGIQRGAHVTIAQLEAADRKARLDTARRAVAEHPLVSAAVELLGAELRDVRLAPDMES